MFLLLTEMQKCDKIIPKMEELMKFFYELRCHRCGAPYQWTSSGRLVNSCSCPMYHLRCEDERHYRVEEWTKEHFSHLLGDRERDYSRLAST